MKSVPGFELPSKLLKLKLFQTTVLHALLPHDSANRFLRYGHVGVTDPHQILFLTWFGDVNS
jgi:hypothetical protein